MSVSASPASKSPEPAQVIQTVEPHFFDLAASDGQTDAYFKASSLRPTQALMLSCHAAAHRLKTTLNRLKLNVVTVESLTAGMIAKTLVDLPQPSSGCVYGGFVVYDTDAKRRWCNVTTEGVYSQKTARQMAEGALRNSRAMVAIAVTGQAMALFGHEDEMGKVDIGVSLRLEGENRTVTQHFDASQDKHCAEIINTWKLQIQDRKSTRDKAFADLWLTSMAADVIRLKVTEAALQFANQQILINAEKRVDEDGLHGFLEPPPTKPYAKLSSEEWDPFSEPSWIIQAHMEDQSVARGAKTSSSKVETDLPYSSSF